MIAGVLMLPLAAGSLSGALLDAAATPTASGWDSLALAWVLTVGAATIGRTDAFGDQTVWSRFGEGYGYLPLALPLLTLAWLTHGHPRHGDAPTAAQPAPPRSARRTQSPGT